MDTMSIISSAIHYHRVPTMAELMMEVDATDKWTVAHSLAGRKIKGKPIIPFDFPHWHLPDITGRSVLEEAIAAHNLPEGFDDFEPMLHSGMTVAHYCFKCSYFPANLIKRLEDKRFAALRDKNGVSIAQAHKEAVSLKLRFLMPSKDLEK